MKKVAANILFAINRKKGTNMFDALVYLFFIRKNTSISSYSARVIHAIKLFLECSADCFQGAHSTIPPIHSTLLFIG